MPSPVNDYVVGFKIFEGKSLQTEDGGPCDPFVLVECCENEFRTATMENKVTKSLVQWNEGYIWPDIPLHQKQFESATIEFSVYARYWFGRNFLIGKAAMQLAFINNRPRHLYARTWLQLKREDSTECTGELNVSVYALKPGQQAPSATEQNEVVQEQEGEGAGDDMDDLGKHVLKAAPEAQTGGRYHLRLIVSRVEDLRDLPMGGGPPSPYVTVEFANCLVQTVRGDCVNMFTFNEEIVIPVTSPIFEDLIAIKLWTSSSIIFSDELIAQGNISFRSLRNEAMAPRWFNLYGWNEEEIPDPASLIDSGVQLKPNYFKGRLLLSAQVELLREGEDLQRATHLPSRPVPDPETIQLALLADVYMVTGAEGRRCRVEISFGSYSKSTGLVDYDTQSITSIMNEKEEEQQRVAALKDKPADDEEEEEGEKEQAQETVEDVNSFTFSEKDGRIDPVMLMAPEESESQPRVLVNVYTEGRFRSERRIGYAMCGLGQFPAYDQGCPAKPRFLALEPMPDVEVNRTAPSVLIAIERHNSDEVARHTRKTIKPMVYIVRTYCFLARRIAYEGMAKDADPGQYALRVSCAGMSRTTEMAQGPRPMWMQHMDMKVILCSDSAQETPTIEPITVILVEQGSLISTDLGQAVCMYSHLRKKNSVGRWSPYKLEPQWIQVMDVNGGGPVGEVLVAFELLLWKHREEMALQPRDMWPQPEASFDPKEHFCRLKKATLHFSLHGLRDIAPLPNVQALGFVGGYSHVTRPKVTVEVNRFFQVMEDIAEDSKLTFDYMEVLPGGDKKLQSQAFQKWRSKVGLDRDGSNFEFMQVGQMNVLIPDKMLLQPYLSIKVWEDASEEVGLMGHALGYGGPTLVGESLQSLADHLPCCWLEDVSLETPYAEQRPLIRKRLAEARAAAKVRESFQQASEAELKEQAQADAANASVSLKISIFKATGMADANMASPFCTCEIRGKTGSRSKTKVGSGQEEITWNQELVIANFEQGDSLFFRVRDKDKPTSESVVGSASLHSDRFYPDGFSDELPLRGPSGGAMHLVVEVRILAKEKQRKRSRWSADVICAPEEKSDPVTLHALPAALKGEVKQKRSLDLRNPDLLNMRASEPFSPRRGEAARVDEHGRKMIHGKLEHCSDPKIFVHDFWYKAMPLLRNHDLVQADDHSVDWNFLPDLTFGFVKCAFKLTDGWEADDALGAGMERGLTRCLSFATERKSRTRSLTHDLEEQDEEDDVTKLRRSFEFDQELNSWGFEEWMMQEKFKGATMPSRVRVRLYLVKAVCVFGKSSGFADPYIEFQLGRYITVSMKNMVKPQTNTPEFYHIEERDIQLPVDGRLEVRIMDYDDMSTSLIGSTVIDLEDRWHSTAWKRANEIQRTPMEIRPLYTPEHPGKNRGSLEMWIEMVESTRAGEVQAADIRKPAEIEVEVRFVIWGTCGVRPFKDGYTNVKLSTKLDCKEYGGEHPEFQETDIHYNSRDSKAVFNWRIVYPRIQMPSVACSVQFCLYHAETLGDEPIGMLDFNLQEYVTSVAKDLTARTVGPGDITFQSIDTDEEDVGSVSITLYVMTQSEATSKRQGLGQSEPNDDPQLLTPIEGREWGDYMNTFGFSWPDFGLWKKVLPLVISGLVFLFMMVALRQAGLL